MAGYGRGAETKRRGDFIKQFNNLPVPLALLTLVMTAPYIMQFADNYMWPHVQSGYGSDLGIVMYFVAVAALFAALFYILKAGMMSSFVGFAVAVADKVII